MAECQLLRLEETILCDAVFHYVAACGFSQMSNGIKLSLSLNVCDIL